MSTSAESPPVAPPPLVNPKVGELGVVLQIENGKVRIYGSNGIETHDLRSIVLLELATDGDFTVRTRKLVPVSA